MSVFRYLVLMALTTSIVQGVDLQKLQHKVLYDQRTYVRDIADRRYSVWTDDQVKATKMLSEFALVVPAFELRKGQVVAIFFNDHITEDLSQITYNKTARATFADYSDSGVRYKLTALEDGKKYSHVTVVVFTSIGTPSHLGLRGMIPDGLSERR